ncbi:hypothetical protein HMPREF9442_00017 [Paraprevotella xylaniphila YIT 11841]|uniref:Uncharacterized protein n=1 Tax=Paraprevotella xylaniphila YIT 11841 TaxID=762982 RepID=F3QPD0_9BACT|nr:hypothetical protein [Paraprevotella xylaniphila]EGG58124.1 hypothetical protein HMPREF9442_00017 [Paraprevotella xylaniphila YIT 11841]
MKCKECVIRVKIVLQSGRNHFAFIYSIEKEIFESHKKISAQTKINLSQTIFHSAEIDFSFGAQNPAHFRRETKKAVVPEYYKYF